MSYKFKHLEVDIDWDSNTDGSLYIIKVRCDCGADITELLSENDIMALENKYAYDAAQDLEQKRGDDLYDQMRDDALTEKNKF